MPSSWWYKVLGVVALVVLSVVVLVPTFLGPKDLDDPESWPGWYRWYHDNIFSSELTLGLDLQGGLHMQYTVDVETAILRKIEGFAADIEDQLETEVEIVDGTTLRLQLPTETADEDKTPSQALDDILTLYPQLERHNETGRWVRLEMSSRDVEVTREWALETAISTIRSRVDGLGVAEPSIRTQGSSDIIVELPGLGEERFEEAKRLIGTTAQLEFHGIHDRDGSYWRTVVGLLPEDSSLEFYNNAIWGSVKPNDPDAPNGLDELRAFADDLEALDPESPTAPPEDSLIVFEEQIEYHPRSGEVLETRYRMMLAKAHVEMTGETISDTRPATDPNTNKPYVSLTFDREGTRLFCDTTTEYEGRRLAIVLDDIVKSAPVINEQICGGRAQITMGSTGSYDSIYREVEGLVIVLRHGALPAPIEPQFETQVGPSLGADSVRKGTTAMIVGSLLVILFMVIYYKLAGVLANIALMLNILFVLAMLTAVRATMTLPGIAGIILTVGMAVDANVIIFERIREELRLGKTARDAVASGYAKALWTVLDANITTAIAALVLANYGSGPIKGFAITLLFGIVSSVFTALFITRMIFDALLTRRPSQRLSI